MKLDKIQDNLWSALMMLSDVTELLEPGWETDNKAVQKPLSQRSRHKAATKVHKIYQVIGGCHYNVYRLTKKFHNVGQRRE